MAEFIFETKTVWDGKLVYRRMLLKRGTGSGERGAGNGERKSGNELSAETSIKISKMAGKDQGPGKIDDREASKQHLRSLFY